MSKNKIQTINDNFGHRLRVRVSGICVRDESILMVKHTSLGKNGILWAPPGGGMNYSESAESNLRREFLEETGIRINTESFLFTHEFLNPPLHAIELFFLVREVEGSLKTGSDPELSHDVQIINTVQFLPFAAIKTMAKEDVHHIFSLCNSLSDLLKLQGYFNFEDHS